MEIGTPVANRLLQALPRDEYNRLVSHSQLVRLPRNRILYESGDEVRAAYFVIEGMVSLLAITEDGQTADMCTVGERGCGGNADYSECSRRCHVGLSLKCHALR